MVPYPLSQPLPGSHSFRGSASPILWVLSSLSLLFVGGSKLAAQQENRPEATGLIRTENAQAGAIDWQLTRARIDGGEFRSPWVEGYCSRQSVSAGESIDIMISTDPAREIRLEVFRLGYYGGRGARKMLDLGTFSTQTQPTPTPGDKNLHECRWEKTTTLTIPKDWVSGVYLGRMTTIPTNELEPYWQSYVIWIVRDDRPADILFQCSDNTWQAYNRWPNNYSIYTHPKGNQGPWADVSFDRPYGREAQYKGIVNAPLTLGAGSFFPSSFHSPTGWSNTAMM